MTPRCISLVRTSSLHCRPHCLLNISISGSHRLLKFNMPESELLAILSFWWVRSNTLGLCLPPSFSYILTSNSSEYTVNSIVLIYPNSGHFSPSSLLSAGSKIFSFLECYQTLDGGTEDVSWPYIQVSSCWYTLPDVVTDEKSDAIVHCVFLGLM